ncbi:FAD-containing oxidoreductase [Persicimonas caeni]|uniref:FAD-containing oxidoreductase n=2 Tax=Persicimonas caeni TaxID=2292766 RepID=A0A4Y6Q314_PERCE|nr:FAD-containing oxidoreductase [Persicimonas caeni]QED36196.1 FAD-containing oxidoreductase [Persicimonas caeni]
MHPDELIEKLRENVEITDRTYRLETYEDCFVGEEACAWMVEAGVARDIEEAERIGNLLLEAGVFHHVLREHKFENDYLFYRFSSDEDHGRKAESGSGGKVSWSDVFGPAHPGDSGVGLQPRMPDDVMLQTATKVDQIGVEPMDEANVELLDQVHPPAWVNPEPKDRYNMVVIGAGTGGLVTAAAVAGLGGKVAIIEKHLMGGDCLNFGCVPSKALLRAARAAAEVRRAGEFGVHVRGEVEIDFGQVMERVRAVRAQLSHHDSAERFAKELGVDVFLGEARFSGPNTVRVGETELDFAKACIATGAQPAVPSIAGLKEAPYLTSSSLFNLTELPARFGVIGAGPIGAEMAQAFSRLGAQVTLFDIQERILPREDVEAAEIVHRALEEDGVVFRLGADIGRVSSGDESSSICVHLNVGEAGRETCKFDQLLVATGRRPNVTELGLEEAGVEFDERHGVAVDDRLQTTNSDIYAVGDVATRYRFTHAADFMARMVVRNALFFGRQKFDDLLIPWCTYTDPEVAHVGLYPRDLEERGINYRTLTQPFDEVDRAVLEGESEGFVRLHVDDSGAILGATIVGPRAGDLISEITVAMRAGMELDTLADVIHPYPTTASAIRQAGDAYNRTRLTLTVKKLLRRVLSMRR